MDCPIHSISRNLGGDAYLPKPEALLFLRAARSLSAVAGGFFLFLLVLIHLPSAQLFRRSFRGIPKTPSLEAIRKRNWIASAGRFAAILAPIIAVTPFADYIKSVLKNIRCFRSANDLVRPASSRVMHVVIIYMTTIN
jgi:hypothetical protein